MHWLVPYSIRVRPPQSNLTLSRINKKGDKGHPVRLSLYSMAPQMIFCQQKIYGFFQIFLLITYRRYNYNNSTFITVFKDNKL
jgi:hypothetical protein